MATSALFDGPASLRAEFVGSMPAAYALAFGSAEHAEHLDIVNRRQGRPVHIERWRTLQNDTTIICIIADDRSGLLSLICEALVAVQLEIVSAQIYSRQIPSGEDEAVDFFWVRARTPAEPRCATAREVGELERTLGEMILLGPMREQSRCSTEPPRTLDPIPTPRAFFDPTLLRRHQYLLVVESRDYPGLLLTITRALTKAGLEVLSSNVTTQGWLARDCFEVRDPSLSELSPGRLSHIRASIVLAVQQGANGFLRR